MDNQKAELSAQMEELQKSLRSLGIPLSSQIQPEVMINTRAKRRLGCCYYSMGMHTIEVSSSLLDRPELLRGTLIHELLHTCPGCRNHGKRWKAYAAMVNAALGCSIERTAGDEGEPAQLRHEEIKYLVECQACGTKIYRMRKSRLVKAPWRYRCICGGKLKSTEYKKENL